jgi:hypothetical protein
MYFEIRKTKVKRNKPAQHYFVLRSGVNGQIVMTSENYLNPGDMRDTMNSIHFSLHTQDKIEIRVAK